MYALIQTYHECKTSEIEVSVAGAYETFFDAHTAMKQAIDACRALHSDCRWDVYGNDGYVENESFDRWEWMVLDTDGKMHGLYTVSAYEFGFDEEE